MISYLDTYIDIERGENQMRVAACDLYYQFFVCLFYTLNTAVYVIAYYYAF